MHSCLPGGPFGNSARFTSTAVLAFAAALGAAPALQAQDTPVVLEAPLPVVDGDYFDIPFEVPAGTVELQIVHRPLRDGDILDWGLFDPQGTFRGYGGGNLEDAVVGELAASRSYLPGALPAGTWSLNVGLAKIVSDAPGYHVEITTRTEATLPPSTDRAPYDAPVPLVDEARFYAGDFHVHSEDSGDARPSLDRIASFAAGRGLDFVVVTDHNTNAQVDRLVSAQERALAAGFTVLFVPGVEVTTYAGHATGFGVTSYVDPRVGFGGRGIGGAMADVVQQGGLFSINHPALDLGDLCIGCAWQHPIPPAGTIHGVEIETGGYRQAGFLFAAPAIAFWEQLLDEGHHVAALGGSDDHGAGDGDSSSPIGDPTTLVFAANLSTASLRTGILNSRTVVKMQGPDDPMIVLDTQPLRTGDTAVGQTVTITATVTGGVGERFRFVENGLGVGISEPIVDDPQTFTLERTPDDTGLARVRAEVTDEEGNPRTVTSYVWLKAPPLVEGCTCASATTPPALAALVMALAAARRRRLR